MLTLDKALAKLARQTAADVEPVLDGTDLAGLLEDAATAALWTAETAYVVGDKILATTGNGRVYRCRQVGTSDATEPDWGTCPYLGQPFNDGAALVWEDAGPAPAELWDLRAATQAGWLLKAARLTAECDVTVGPQKFTLSQRVANCERMAARYAPLVVC